MAPAAPSFRDPAGFCFSFRHHIYRFVEGDALADFEAFLRTDCAKDLVARKKMVSSRRLEEGESAALRAEPELKRFFDPTRQGILFEHEAIAFPSFPHEWPPEMLWAAGKLTLEITRSALAGGFSLKDATPDNILFRGSDPVFVDVLSFERRDPHDPIWKPYGQFVRTFLLPLLANRKWNLSMADIFSTRRDGLQPEEVYRWCGGFQKFSPGILSLVSIPTWLSRKANPDDQAVYRQHRVNDPEKAQFILDSLFRRLEKILDALEPRALKSVWSDYMATHSYDDPAFAAKEKFIAEALQEFRPSTVLDAGANTGHFSALAAEKGARVMAVDLDASCVGAIWRRAQEKRLDVLPMVTNLARPTPAMGWRNAERSSFLDRALGKFDGILMLALIHHLLVTERIPLEEIVRLAYELTRQVVVIEWVEPQDAMFRRLTRGRESLHASLNAEVFEGVCKKYFEIVRSAPLPGTARRMDCLKKKNDGI